MTDDRRRWRALGGVVGPIAFVAAWSVLGQRRDGYSPVHDPISLLAATDSSTRWAMTGGFVAFGAGVAVYATEIAAAVPGRTATALATTAAATIGIAATPLGSSLGGGPHAVAAGVAYTALAASPVLAARPLVARGHRVAARASTLAGLATGTALLASVVASSRTGLFQRVGLTIGDAWIVASAFVLIRRRARGR